MKPEAPRTESYRAMVDRVATILMDQRLSEYPIKNYRGRIKEYFDEPGMKALRDAHAGVEGAPERRQRGSGNGGSGRLELIERTSSITVMT